MNKGWKEIELGKEVLLVTKGTTPTSLGKAFKESGVNFIKAESITNSGVFKKEYFAYIDIETHQLLERSQLKENDILFSIAGVIGRIAIVTNQILPANTNQALALIRLSKKTNLNKFYLKYFLKGSFVKEQIRRINVQAAQANFSLTDINNLLILFPPLPQQKKIAKILSTCDLVIEKTEQAIAKYQALKQGLMQDLFTRGIDTQTGKLRPSYQQAPELYKKTELGFIPKEWEVKTVDEIGTAISGGTPSSNIKNYWNGKINWITPSDLSKLSGVTINNSIRKITKLGLENSSALLIRKNSIVISSRAPIGYCAVVLSDFTTNQGCKSLEMNENQNVYFQYYNFILNITRIKEKGEGTTFAEISKKAFEKVKFVSPSIQEQTQIANKLQAIDKKIETEQKSLTKYEQLKAGLMQDLLTGKVLVS